MELLIILVIVVAVAGYGVVLYNRLVTLRNTYRNAYKQIDVALKQRHDMIPALVETVKGYAAHEKETLNAVIEARNSAENLRAQASQSAQSSGQSPDGETIAKLSQAEGTLGSALGRLFALSEAYPDLKADQTFLNLMEEISTMEQRVAASRRGYNNTVLEYNNTVQTVPSNFIANMFAFKTAQELEFEDRDAIQQMPKVSFT
ncbi:LemA family protein [Fodinicurvata sp. EGI_FJ10296]|uniref:LemA family protein n=1 Tax=Fodinicurvata sp. EGI_FJ10296 TaxID=3231908 RepID=UPI0034536FC7